MRIIGYAAAAAAMTLAVGGAHAEVTIPEGTEMSMRLEDTLSSKHAIEGDRFTISLDEDVKLPDGTILRAGYRGVGEIVSAQKSGMMGKSGKINVRLNYMKVGDERVRLRASKGSQAKGNAGAQIVGVVLVGVFAAFIKGHNTEIPKGTLIHTFTDGDTTLQTPLAPPPPTI